MQRNAATKPRKVRRSRMNFTKGTDRWTACASQCVIVAGPGKGIPRPCGAFPGAQDPRGEPSCRRSGRHCIDILYLPRYLTDCWESNAHKSRAPINPC
jgi:hypothetical protein